MTGAQRRWTSSLAGLALGIVALVIVTAILTSAVSSVRAENKASTLTEQIRGLRADNASLRADNASLRTQVAALGADNRALRRQNRQMLSQQRALVTYLREHGLSVPDSVVRAGPGKAHPKGRGPRGPQPTQPPLLPVPTVTPAPTPSPTPSPGLTDLVCALLNIAPCPL
jgi:cell division protein FtsB